MPFEAQKMCSFVLLISRVRNHVTFTFPHSLFRIFLLHKPTHQRNNERALRDQCHIFYLKVNSTEDHTTDYCIIYLFTEGVPISRNGNKNYPVGLLLTFWKTWACCKHHVLISVQKWKRNCMNYRKVSIFLWLTKFYKVFIPLWILIS